jgi:hypothetical protein
MQLSQCFLNQIENLNFLNYMISLSSRFSLKFKPDVEILLRLCKSFSLRNF